MEAFISCYQFLIFLSYITIIAPTSDLTSSCAPGVQSAGVTLPKGDIKIEYGKPLDIWCILNPEQTNLTASSLIFSRDGSRVPEKYLSVVNKTTLHLHINQPPISYSLYSCKLQNFTKELGVCLNYVFVGTKPGPVKNFTCISYNWESLNCSWIPHENPVRTTYRLSYSLRGKHHRKTFQCPLNLDVSHNYCLWNSSSDPPHRVPYEEYFLKLVGSNVFGNYSENYTINHFAVVLPRSPENLSLVEATSSSLTISWSLPLALTNFPAGITTKIKYRSTWDSEWEEVRTPPTNIEPGNYQLNITGLKYAHTLYDIRVYLKSSIAADHDKWWSTPAHITLRTKPTVPKMPPLTDIGSFESISARAHDPDHRTIYIYWQQIPKEYENGEHISYNISVEEIVNGVHILRNDYRPYIYKASAVFSTMSFNSYVFKIVSINKEGPSENYSTIVIPSKDESPAEPVSLRKIAYANGVYDLSWNIPPFDSKSKHSPIQSYTIFWCDNKDDKPYQCSGMLNWTHVSSNVTEKNITLPDDKIYQFAISANTHSSSSGMVWADCTVLPQQGRGRIRNLWISKVGSDFMELTWRLNCLRARSITGFEVTYCPIVGFKCRDGKFSMKSINGNSTSHYRIENLKPYTTYKIVLVVLSAKGAMIKSEDVLQTTMEGVPEDPPVLHSSEVTNASITLAWGPPRTLNGILRHYEVYINNTLKKKVLEKQNPKFTFTGLLSYEVYNISIVACTVSCSNTSLQMSIRTGIGIPGKIKDVAVAYYNVTGLNVTWPPLKSHRGGNNELYDVRVQILTTKEEEISEDFRVYNATGSEKLENVAFQLLTPGCQEADAAHIYKVSVRAINKAVDGTEKYYGPWSEPVRGFCYITPKSFQFSYVYVWIMFGAFIMLAAAYSVRWIWNRCKEMRNIRVKLPPQFFELDNKGNGDLPMTAHVPAQLKPLSGDNKDTPPPDQQLLLDKKNVPVESSNEEGEDTNIDRESSGCGSGHESVSSSITSGTHITDSGTEADERPEDVFSDSPRREAYQRQRDDSRSSSGGDGYCILAQAPSGYVTLPAPMSSYVKHDWTPNGPVKTFHIIGSMTSPTPPMRPQSNEASWTS